MKLSLLEVKALIQESASLLAFSTHLTPQNLASERDTFFGSSSYNPLFSYPPISSDQMTKVLQNLQLVEIENRGVDELIYQKKISELMLQCQLLLAINTPDITAISTQLYRGTFSTKYQNLAKKDAARNYTFEALETLSGEETVVKIQDYLASEYDQHNWDVTVSEQGDFYVRVKAVEKKIFD